MLVFLIFGRAKLDNLTFKFLNGFTDSEYKLSFSSRQRHR